MTIRFLSAADDEVAASARFYEERAAGLGEDFIAEVEYLVGVLLSSPLLGAPYVYGTRRIMLSRFPYYLVYLKDSATIIVVALAHQRQKPGYWKQRV